jgi:O-antigen/teichoic acid export membrane protein
MGEVMKLLRQLREKSLRDEIRKRQVWFRQAGQVTVAAWVSTVLAFIGTVVAARDLGLDDFGSIILAGALAGAIATLLDVTLDEAFVHHGARAVEAGDVGGLRAMVRKSMWVDGIVGVVVATVVLALAAPLADATSGGEMPALLLRLAAIQQLANTLDSTTGATLLVAGRPELRAWSMASQGLLRLVGIVIAVQFGGAEAVMVAWIVAAIGSSMLQGYFAWRVAWRVWAAESPRTVSPVSTGKLLRFGAHTSLSTSVSAVHQALYPVMLASLAGVDAVAIFKIALLPVTIADNASGPIRMVVLPQQARLAAQNRFAELRRAMTLYTMFGLSLSAVGVVLGFFLLPTLIPAVYGHQFDAAATPARILMIAAVSHFAFGWCATFHPAVGRPELRTLFSLIVLLVSAGLLVLLGDSGATGAAIAFSAGSLTSALVFMFWAYVYFLNPRANAQTAAQGQPQPA